MGIFSKFQIKDIKTKILGGKTKHKSEVPSIAVIPPTPSVHEDFSFPQNQEDTSECDKKSVRQTLTRQRSASLPEVFENDSVDSFHVESKTGAVVKSYLKPPKTARKKRRRSRRTISCPENLSEITDSVETSAKGCEKRFSSIGPGENTTGYYEDRISDIGDRVSPQLESENQAFSTGSYNLDANKNNGASCYGELGRDNEIFRHDSITSSSSSHNGVINSMDASPTAEEFSLLCLDSEQQSEKSKKSSNTTFSNEIVQRRTERRKADARWSLDLEKLGAGCSDSSLLSEDSDMKWEGQSSNVPQESKNLASTWSLDLSKGSKLDHNMGRAYSEINFSGSPNLRSPCEPGFSEKVIFNAKSLDLEFVKPEKEAINKSSDTTLEQPVHKRGISEYVGKFNGIVSKFSTWSLDMEVARKRSLEKNLDGAARAQSEMALGAYNETPKKEERALSYHSLLYDFEEASRYQIYQPTVYEIVDENVHQPTEKTVAPNQKLGTYGSSMKFLGKQLEHLYENGKSLYKQSHVIIDAIKQREKELKAIADKEAKAKQANGSDEEKHKFFKPKPKPPPRRRSTSHKKHVQKVNILPSRSEELNLQ